MECVFLSFCAFFVLLAPSGQQVFPVEVEPSAATACWAKLPRLRTHLHTALFCGRRVLCPVYVRPVSVSCPFLYRQICDSKSSTPEKKRKAVAPVRALLLLPPASSYCAVRFVFVSSRPPRRLAWLVTLGLTCGGESLFSFRACSSSSRCMRDRQRRRSTMRF